MPYSRSCDIRSTFVLLCRTFKLLSKSGPFTRCWPTTLAEPFAGFVYQATGSVLFLEVLVPLVPSLYQTNRRMWAARTCWIRDIHLTVCSSSRSRTLGSTLKIACEIGFQLWLTKQSRHWMRTCRKSQEPMPPRALRRETPPHRRALRLHRGPPRRRRTHDPKNESSWSGLRRSIPMKGSPWRVLKSGSSCNAAMWLRGSAMEV